MIDTRAMHLGDEARIDLQQTAHIIRHLLQLDLGTLIEPYIGLVDRRDSDDNPARTDGWGVVVFFHAIRTDQWRRSSQSISSPAALHPAFSSGMASGRSTSATRKERLVLDDCV